MVDPHQALVDARARLATGSEAWTKGSMARDARSRDCSVDAPEATCWCMAGAILAGEPAAYPGAIGILRTVIRTAYPGYAVSSFNDRPATTYEQVLDMFTKAIELSNPTS